MVMGINSTQIKTNLSNDGETYTISVSDNFDFNLVRLFREAYSKLASIPNKIVVDLRHAETIDSAALGMLINMKKTLGKADGEIEIRNCTPTVKRILSIARFDVLFSID
jgi:anti-anti-sigma factor